MHVVLQVFEEFVIEVEHTKSGSEPQHWDIFLVWNLDKQISQVNVALSVRGTNFLVAFEICNRFYLHFKFINFLQLDIPFTTRTGGVISKVSFHKRHESHLTMGNIGNFWCIDKKYLLAVFAEFHLCVFFLLFICLTNLRSQSWFKLTPNLARNRLQMLSWLEDGSRFLVLSNLMELYPQLAWRSWKTSPNCWKLCFHPDIPSKKRKRKRALCCFDKRQKLIKNSWKVPALNIRPNIWGPLDHWSSTSFPI